MNNSIQLDIPCPKVGDVVEHCGKQREVLQVADFGYKWRVWVECNLLTELPGREGYFEIPKKSSTAEEEAKEEARNKFILRVRTLGSAELVQQIEASHKAATDNPAGSGADEVLILEEELKRRSKRGQTRTLYVHDCVYCTFIGTIGLGGDKLLDFYKHARKTDTVTYTEYIWRYGNKGSEYYCTTSIND